MARIERLRVRLEGLPGLPGVSTFYGNDASGLGVTIREFYAALASKFPINLTIQVENTGDQIESTTGQLIGTWVGTPKGVVNGSGTGAYAAPTGAAVTWNTGTVLDGSRVRGRTFLVPLTAACYDLTGNIDEVTLALLRTEASNVTTFELANFLIWHRPRVATPTLPARPGSVAFVSSAVVRDSAAVLRSRRD